MHKKEQRPDEKWAHDNRREIKVMEQRIGKLVWHGRTWTGGNYPQYIIQHLSWFKFVEWMQSTLFIMVEHAAYPGYDHEIEVKLPPEMMLGGIKGGAAPSVYEARLNLCKKLIPFLEGYCSEEEIKDAV